MIRTVESSFYGASNQMPNRGLFVANNRLSIEAEIEQHINQLLADRAETSSICPSEVARSLETDEAAWRALMPKVRAVAWTLQTAGEIRITRKDEDVTEEMLENGPIRLRRGTQFKQR